MPQLLAELSLGNTGVKGNLFLRNRSNVYIKILTCSDAKQNKRLKERGENELIGRWIDGRTDGLPCEQGIRKTKQTTDKSNEHSGKQET